MPDTRQDLDELAERRLADRVEEKVKSRLTALYGLLGGAALTVLAFFGYNVVSDFRTTAHQTATDAAEAAAKAAIDPVISQAKTEVAQLKEEAKVELGQVKDKETEADRLITRVHDRLDALDESVAKGQEQAARMAEQATTLKAEMATTADDIRDKFEAAKSQIAVLGQTIDAQKQRAQGQFADGGTVADLAKLVQKLADQVSGLDAQLRDIAARSNISLPPPEAAAGTLVAEAQSTAQVAAVAASHPTVFFQFSAISRDEAKSISAALGQRGYLLPGEDQEAAAALLKQVRYFFDQDKAAASLLAIDTKAVLAQLGYGAIEIDLRDFTNYPGKKPRPGVLELWLGTPPK